MQTKPTQNTAEKSRNVEASTLKPGRAERRLFQKPAAWADLEQRVGEKCPVHPHLLSAAKLLIVTPLLAFSLLGGEVLPALHGLFPCLLLFAAFFSLDYLDGVVARARGLESGFGRVFDRLTDYPLLILVSWTSLDVLPQPLVLAKVAVDTLLLLLFLRGHGSTENRLRTGISYTALLSLLLVSQGFASHIITPHFVEQVLVLNIVFSSVVALFNLRFFSSSFLQRPILLKRRIADALSAANLLCGGFSMLAASRGRFDLSLLFLLVGATFDGFDGAAARRWGGTRFGVYADDIADGVNYGIAPGVALYFALGGATGIVLGVGFALFTIARLIYFTLNAKRLPSAAQAENDPNYFAGAPSTVGGIMVLCALILFGSQPALLGLFVGVACILMVSFDSAHKHLGRAAARHPRRLLALPPLGFAMLVSWLLVGVHLPVAALLIGVLGYSLLPVLRHFAWVLGFSDSSSSAA